MTRPSNDIVQVLIDARDYLRNHGWIRGVMVAGDGRVCAAGAVYKSIYRQEIIRPGQYYRTMVELQEELGNEYDGTFMSVTEFNDVRAQSQQDIEDLFTKTIRRLQEEQ